MKDHQLKYDHQNLLLDFYSPPQYRQALALVEFVTLQNLTYVFYQPLLPSLHNEQDGL